MEKETGIEFKPDSDDSEEQEFEARMQMEDDILADQRKRAE